MRAKAKVITAISARRRPDQDGRVDAVEQLARLFVGQHRGLAGLDDVLGTAHRMRRIDRDDLAGDQPVEQHADRGEVLLDRRLLKFLPEIGSIATNSSTPCAIPNGGGSMPLLLVANLLDRPVGIIEIGGSGPA
jgi:hypothetical protein